MGFLDDALIKPEKREELVLIKKLYQKDEIFTKNPLELLSLEDREVTFVLYQKDKKDKEIKFPLNIKQWPFWYAPVVLAGDTTDLRTKEISVYIWRHGIPDDYCNSLLEKLTLFNKKDKKEYPDYLLEKYQKTCKSAVNDFIEYIEKRVYRDKKLERLEWNNLYIRHFSKHSEEGHYSLWDLMMETKKDYKNFSALIEMGIERSLEKRPHSYNVYTLATCPLENNPAQIKLKL